MGLFQTVGGNDQTVGRGLDALIQPDRDAHLAGSLFQNLDQAGR